MLLLENGLITSWFSGPLERHLSSLFSDKDTELYLWDSELVTEDFHAAEKFWRNFSPFQEHSTSQSTADNFS